MLFDVTHISSTNVVSAFVCFALFFYGICNFLHTDINIACSKTVSIFYRFLLGWLEALSFVDDKEVLKV